MQGEVGEWVIACLTFGIPIHFDFKSGKNERGGGGEEYMVILTNSSLTSLLLCTV